MRYETIAKNIDVIRNARGFTKTKLAELMGTSQPTVSKHLKEGKMSLETLAKYAEVLGCSVGDIADGFTDREKFTLEDDVLARYPYNLAVAVVMPYEKDDEAAKELAREYAYKVYAPAVERSMDDLADRERKILECRFKNGMTLEEVGKIYGVTRDRIRQIEAKALRKLRHPMRWKTWTMDVLSEAETVKAERDALARELEFLKADMEKIAWIAEGKPEPKPEETKRPENRDGVKLEDLDLSVRAYNCFKRAGFTKLGDFRGKTVEDLLRTRNLGRKSLDETLQKLAEHGIYLPLDEDDEDTPEIKRKAEEAREKAEAERKEDPDIEVLDLSVRSHKSLKRAGICTVSALAATSREDLGKVRNLSQNCVKEIAEKLRNFGIEIRD